MAPSAPRAPMAEAGAGGGLAPPIKGSNGLLARRGGVGLQRPLGGESDLWLVGGESDFWRRRRRAADAIGAICGFPRSMSSLRARARARRVSGAGRRYASGLYRRGGDVRPVCTGLERDASGLYGAGECCVRFVRRRRAAGRARGFRRAPHQARWSSRTRAHFLRAELARDETRPLSTGRGTRRVHLVQGEGRDAST